MLPLQFTYKQKKMPPGTRVRFFQPMKESKSNRIMTYKVFDAVVLDDRGAKIPDGPFVVSLRLTNGEVRWSFRENVEPWEVQGEDLPCDDPKEAVEPSRIPRGRREKKRYKKGPSRLRVVTIGG